MRLIPITQPNDASKPHQPRITTLAADNSNQHEWLRTARTWARANSAEIFFLKKMKHARARRRRPVHCRRLPHREARGDVHHCRITYHH